jgi:Cu(I)/Ag(I) efflux system protein CusF
MIKPSSVLVCIALSGGALTLSAQSTAQTATGNVPAEARVVPAELNEGEVRKVDRESRKITLKHGAIQSLDMPPMTMVFHVGDAAMLDRVSAGEKVHFKASNEGGKFTITEIRSAR